MLHWLTTVQYRVCIGQRASEFRTNSILCEVVADFEGLQMHQIEVINEKFREERLVCSQEC